VEAVQNSSTAVVQWRFTAFAAALLVTALALATVPFAGALGHLYDAWIGQPEYSHGILIPAISLFLIWRHRSWLATTEFTGSWAGLLPIAAGLIAWFIGELSTLYTLVQYGFLFVLYGLVLSLVGWQVFRKLWMPLLILVFMVPLPAFFSNALSLKLQLLSSAVGVGLIRLAGISVFLEGNVIDLGTYQLQVAEACDGLRYLFPLMTLAFILSYLYRAPMWKRVTLFLASIPIAILMNSLRIGVIGITVEYWGQEMAEGFLHDFEGWAVFMASTAVLILTAMVLSKIGRSTGNWRDALAIDFGAPLARSGQRNARSLRTPFFGASALASCAALAAFTMPSRVEIAPARTEFAEFPTQVGAWQGRRDSIEAVYLDALKLDDYLFANYARPASAPVNFYVAWYDSQRKGQSAHSPRSCLPGGGWTIKSLQTRSLPNSGIEVNRALIELGSQRQIVYYWFQQRGRAVTNEYLVKWYIFWDALTRARTDGALVRLTAMVPSGADEASIDSELTNFAAAIAPSLRSYVPD
jgi:exosortase D (VPLPA-CTERM-specific)